MSDDDFDSTVTAFDHARQADQQRFERPGLLERLRLWFITTYNDEVTRQRHIVEEDARRLNGRVIWEDAAQ